MARPLATIVAGWLSVSALACGRKAPLVMPQGRGPAAVESLTAVQRGAAVFLEWSNPAKTVSGRPLAGLKAAEVWSFEGDLTESVKVSAAAELEKKGRRVLRLEGLKPASRQEARVVLDIARGLAKTSFSVRVFDPSGRPSELSPPAVVALRAAPERPRDVELRVGAEAVELRWAPPEANIDGSRPAAVTGFTVLRSEEGGPFERLTSTPIPGPTYEDRRFEFGRLYAYAVRAVAETTEGVVESEDTEPVLIRPMDVFPPAPPSDVVAVAAEGRVAVSWAGGGDPDLDGFRVWRREAEGTSFVLLEEGLTRARSFVDRPPGGRGAYVYAVSAVDRSGNESARTESSPVVVREVAP